MRISALITCLFILANAQLSCAQRFSLTTSECKTLRDVTIKIRIKTGFTTEFENSEDGKIILKEHRTFRRSELKEVMDWLSKTTGTTWDTSDTKIQIYTKPHTNADTPVENNNTYHEPQTVLLSPVTVTGKGSYEIPDRLNPGNVGRIEGRTIENQSSSNVLKVLAGKTSGLLITQTSGIIGSSVDIKLRGLNSMFNGTGPLYVVDGLPLSPDPLNQLANAAGYMNGMQLPRPDQIEKIEILKDADATAIYGSRGANGVILITTKKGKAGKTALTVDVSTGYGGISNRIKLMNTEQYVAMRRQAIKNDGLQPTDKDFDLTKWDMTRNTNWQRQILGNVSKSTQAGGTITGGNKNTQFLFGANYRRETVPIPGQFEQTNKSLDLAISHQSDSERISLQATLHYLNSNNHLPQFDPTSAIMLAPNAELYTSSGELNWEGGGFENPMAQLYRDYIAIFNHLSGSLHLSYKIMPDLYFKIQTGYNFIQLNESLKIPLKSFNPYENTSSTLRSQSIGTSSTGSWIAEPQINYKRKNSTNQFDFLAALNFQESRQHTMLITGSDFENDELIRNIGMARSLKVDPGESLYKYRGAFIRVGYVRKDEIVLNGTFRYDGSSRFGAHTRYEPFYSLAAAWLFTENAKMKQFDFLKDGKIYANFGKTGNDQISDYEYLNTFNSSPGYDGVLGLRQTRLINNIYSWEILKKVDLGIKFRLFDKYQMNINWYRGKTKNQLVKSALPNISGYKYTLVNLPAIVENKSLEMEFKAEFVKAKDFELISSLNITFPQNKLVKYPNIESSMYSNVFAEGKTLAVRYLYHNEGINPMNGIFQVADLNHDGKTNQGDLRPVEFTTTFYGGAGTAARYHDFSLEIFFQFVKQTGYYSPAMETPGRLLVGMGNQSSSLINTQWQYPGQHAESQKYTATDFDARTATSRFNQSDGTRVDASYLKLGNVSFSWQIPQTLLKRLNVKSGQISINGQNLFNYTPYKGLDAEIQRYHSIYNLPTQTSATVTVHLTI